MFLRPGLLAAVAFFAGIALYSSSVKPDPTWVLGQCVKATGTRAVPAQCGNTHQGKIVAVAAAADEYPSAYQGHVIIESKKYCVDKSG
jgi:hypothetical protein